MQFDLLTEANLADDIQSVKVYSKSKPRMLNLNTKSKIVKGLFNQEALEQQRTKLRKKKHRRNQSLNSLSLTSNLT